MNEQSSAFRTGLFLLATVLLALVVILGAGDASWLWKPQDTHVAVFEPGTDLQGLSEKSEVRVMGVKLGHVKSVEIVQTPAGAVQAQVKFTLPRQYQFRTGAALRVQAGLTGDSVLNVQNFGDGKLLAQDEPVKATSYGLDALMADARETLPVAREALHKFGDASASIQGTVETANKLLARIDHEVDNLVARYNKVTDTADAALGNARDILGDNKADIRESLGNLKTLTANAKLRTLALFDSLDKITGKADSVLTHADEILPMIAKEVLPKIGQVLEHADKSLSQVDVILTDGKVVTATARTLIAENRQNINATFIALRRSSEDLQAGISEIRAAPWRLFHKPKPEEQDNLKILDATRRYAQSAQDLNDAAGSLRYAAENPHTDPARLKELQEELLREAGRFDQIQKEMWDLYKPVGGDGK